MNNYILFHEPWKSNINISVTFKDTPAQPQLEREETIARNGGSLVIISRTWNSCAAKSDWDINKKLFAGKLVYFYNLSCVRIGLRDHVQGDFLMVDSYKTIDFLRERKIKLGNATYIIDSHFLEQGQTLKEKIENLIKLEISNFSNYKLGQTKEI